MSKDCKLSTGALEVIMKGGDFPQPIMQILGSKKINSGNAEKERYRILLSDGKYSVSFAMYTVSIHDKTSLSAVQVKTVVKIKNFITSVINNAGKGDARILLLLEMEVIVPGNHVKEIIGSPVPLPDDMISTGKPSTTSNGNATQAINKNNATGVKLELGQDMNQLSISRSIVCPISSINPYHNSWVIKARITNKSNIRTWSNSRGEGKLFSFDLIDESGQIRCTAFRDLVDKFYDFINVDKVYYLSKCQVKTANKQFSPIKNDYELTLVNDSAIEECHDSDSNIPQTQYDFVPIDRIRIIEVGTIIDIIGVCKSASDLQTFTARSTGRELKKRELTLLDQTKNSVAVTLWGSQAESFDGTNNPVVVIKGAKIGEFSGGKNVSVLMSSQVKINPDIPECYRLKGWFDLEGNNTDIVNVSARTDGMGFTTPWMSFKVVRDNKLGTSEKGDYFQVMGVILLARHENTVYKACPTEECNKKVVDLENGMFSCEKCNQQYPNFKYRLLLSANVADWSGNQWISMFSSEAEKVLDTSAQVIGNMEPEAVLDVFKSTNFKSFIFKCRAKMETYNDESRLKIVVVKVDPINYEEYNNHLIESIQQFLN